MCLNHFWETRLIWEHNKQLSQSQEYCKNTLCSEYTENEQKLQAIKNMLSHSSLSPTDKNICRTYQDFSVTVTILKPVTRLCCTAFKFMRNKGDLWAEPQMCKSSAKARVTESSANSTGNLFTCIETAESKNSHVLEPRGCQGLQHRQRQSVQCHGHIYDQRMKPAVTTRVTGQPRDALTQQRSTGTGTAQPEQLSAPGQGTWCPPQTLTRCERRWRQPLWLA